MTQEARVMIEEMTTAEAELASVDLARLIAGHADAKQASDIVALDVSGLVSYTDVLVICTARNERLAKAIHDEVHERLKKEEGRLPARVEGVASSQWILMDYLDCILHIQTPEMRERYRLESLWGEGPALEL